MILWAGMHCSGDIDITRTRWSEDPTLLVPLILGNIKNFAPGASRVRHDQGRTDAGCMMNELSSRLHALRGGKRKAKKAAR